MFIFQIWVIDFAIFPARLVCALASCPLVCSGFLLMFWPERSQDDAVCSQRLKQIQEVLSAYIPAAEKFEQLYIVMLQFEEADWEIMTARHLAKQAASLGQVVGDPGHAKHYGLPACPFSSDFAAKAPSSATWSTSLSGGAPAPVAPPLSAPIAMPCANAASVEAFKQQALANKTRAQAEIQAQYERDLSQLG